MIWGFLNALYIMPSIIFNTNRNNLDIVAQGKYFPSIKDFFSMVLTFSLTVFAWIFFRSENLHQAIKYVSKIFSSSVCKVPYFAGIGLIIPTVIFIVLLLIIEWAGREKQYAIQTLGLGWPKFFRYLFYCSLTFAILYFSVATSEKQFIYFQF